MQLRSLYVALAFTVVSRAAAQSITDTVILPELTISENRIKTPVSRTSRNVSVIDSKQMEDTPARSAQEMLAFNPGIDMRQRGISGTQADLGIRGGSFEQSLLLLNGMKLSDPQTGHHMMNLPLPLVGIDRMEVYKGPASNLFGQNAYSGAVNIITELKDIKKLKVEVLGGDFKMRGANLYVSLPLKKYRQALSASHDASDGHWHNSDFKVSSVFYEGAYRFAKGQETRIMTGLNAREFGANGFYTNRFPDQWESVQTSFASLQHSYTSSKLNAQARVYYRQNNDEFRLFRYRTDAFRNLHRSEVLAVELNAVCTTALGKTGVGLETREEDIKSSNLGERSRRMSGIYIEHLLNIRRKIDIRAGVYANYYEQYGLKYFPGAELGWQLHKRSRLYTNVGYSFRIPTYTELYYQDQATSSNPALKPEEALSYEAGYRFKHNRIEASLAAFRRQSNNLIDYSRAADDAAINENKWVPRNIVAVDFNGLEWSAQYVFKETERALRIKYLAASYNYIQVSLGSDSSIESRYSLTALKHQLIARTQIAVLKRFALNVSWRFLERYNHESYQLIDAKLNIALPKKMRGFIELNNITDARYVEAGFVQMPGRWIKAGIAITVF